METNNIDKTFRNVLVIILVISLFILIESKLQNVRMKNSSDPGVVEMSGKEIKNMLASDTKRISLLVESIQKIPEEIALIMEFQKINKEEIKIIQHSILLNSPELFGTALAFEPHAFDKNRRYFSSFMYRSGDTISHMTLDGSEYDYFNQDWYIIPKILKTPVWSNPYYDEGGGNVFMTSYSVPFYSFDGVKETFVGIITVDVSIFWLADFAIHCKALPYNGFVILISEDGTIISAPDIRWIMNETIFTLSLSLKIPELRKIGRDLQKGKSGVRKITGLSGNEKLSVYYSAVHANKWGLLYLIPEKAWQKEMQLNDKNITL